MIGGFDFNGNGRIDPMDHAIGYQIYKNTTNDSSNSCTSGNNYSSGSQKKSGGSFGPVLLFAAVLSILSPNLKQYCLY